MFGHRQQTWCVASVRQPHSLRQYQFLLQECWRNRKKTRNLLYGGSYGVMSVTKVYSNLQNFFFGFLLLFSGVEVELGAVDDVLPHDVGSGAYGDEWVKIGECHPDAEDGVFLAETLCS